jgi:hypothetical protein
MQIGLLVGLGFALGWAVAGASNLPRIWRTLTFAMSVVITGVLGALSVHTRSKSGHFNGAICAVAVSAETLAIVVVSVLLNRRGNASLIAPLVAIIVGLHYIGLWKAMGAPDVQRCHIIAGAGVRERMMPLLKQKSFHAKCAAAGFLELRKVDTYRFQTFAA